MQNPVPPVVNIKLIPFHHTTPSGFLKENDNIVTAAEGVLLVTKTSTYRNTFIQEETDHTARKLEVWGIYFIDHRKWHAIIEFLKVNETQ